MKMDDLMKGASVASATLRNVRDDARVLAVKTIRVLEQRLRGAIAGDTIRGLSSLVGQQFGNFQAIRVHGSQRFGIDDMLPLDGREALVVTKDGALAMAHVTYGEMNEPGDFSCRSVGDDELTAQDLEPFVRAVRSALERHVQRAERTTANYERAADLAHNLAEVLEFTI